MSGDVTERERRAANRRRRRGDDGNEPEQGEAVPMPQFQEALKSAASAAAMGAAVGAARAYSARRHEPDDAVPPVPDDDPGEAPSDEVHVPQEREAAPEPESEAPQAEPATRDQLREIVEEARLALRDLHGTDAESVSFVGRNGEGWVVGLEVVEVRRIPDSTDVLATYEVELDGDGGVLRFERTRRYSRSEADRGGRG
jgi:hypothetical protein